MPDLTAGTGPATAIALSAVVPVLGAAPAVVPHIVVFGFAVGLRADVLLAGFGGSVVAIAFFNAVPSTGDTVGALLRDSWRRMWWCLASSLTAGYITPLMLLADGAQLRIPDSLMLSAAFVVGAAAQSILGRYIKRGEDRAAGTAPAPKGANDAAT